MSTKFLHFIFLLSTIFTANNLTAQSVLFDFDSAPLHSSLPIDLTVGGITAHFSATGQGYSIQDNSAPVVPVGFTGRYIYPNSIYAADLLVKFDQTLTYFSIMYSVQELACDTSATMRVTAYMSGSYVGTNTKVASVPGTWPVDTLKCSFPQGFDSVVVHFDSHPSACQDWGPIFLADNMWVTPLNPTAVSDPKDKFPEKFTLQQNCPNPFNPTTLIHYVLAKSVHVRLSVFDMLGRDVATLVNELQQPGNKSVEFNSTALPSGVYFYRIIAGGFVDTKKMVVIK